MEQGEVIKSVEVHVEITIASNITLREEGLGASEMSSVQKGKSLGKSTPTHRMKTTKRGRTYARDLLDLYSAFILSLHLSTHKKFFRSFRHSFSIDQATQNMASLTFSQSNRGPDPRDPSRVVTTTTSTTFSMTPDMAKALSQHFTNAHLIKSATNISLNPFKERRVYQLTPKGLHVLERFITKNGIDSDQLQPVFSSQPICIKLLHLERRNTDDEIIVTRSVIIALFRHFVGRQPNYTLPADKSLDTFQKYNERSKGIELNDVTERARPQVGKPQQLYKHCFNAVTALDWICDFTTVVDRDEAAQMSAHFVRFGLITLLSDNRKKKESAIIFTARGPELGNRQGQFIRSEKIIYRITDEGCRLANWGQSRVQVSQDAPRTSSNLKMSHSYVDSSVNGGHSEQKQASDPNTNIHISLAAKPNVNGDSVDRMTVTESNTERLRYILEDPVLRSLFREFLWNNFGDKSLSFWFDVEDLQRKFNTTSSAMATSSSTVSKSKYALERHHDTLINATFTIYNTYLAPSSEHELNIDPVLRNDMFKYLGEVVTNFQGRVELDQVHGLNFTQLQTLIRFYKQYQTLVFRLMATDSVPKFIKTRTFLDMQYWIDDINTAQTGNALRSAGPAGITDPNKVGGVYITISAQASERIHRLLTAATAEPAS